MDFLLTLLKLKLEKIKVSMLTIVLLISFYIKKYGDWTIEKLQNIGWHGKKHAAFCKNVSVKK